MRPLLLSKKNRAAGFTLIELMIVVAIVAILVAVAVVAYTRHIRHGRIVQAQTFVSAIQAREEMYFQRFGVYCNASSTTGCTGNQNETNFYPSLINGSEPFAKPWVPAGGVPRGWQELGARPESNNSIFEWNVTASLATAVASTNHALTLNATTYGVPPQPTDTSITRHPWYYIVGRADLNGKGTGSCATTDCTILIATYVRSDIMVQNEGE